MAERISVFVDEALRSVATQVTCEGIGQWRLSILNGEVLPLQARMTSGWLALTASLPSSARAVYGDLLALQVNEHLPGSARVARLFGDHEPHVRADTWIEHAQDLTGWLSASCSALTTAAHAFTSIDNQPAGATSASSQLVADVERACCESGWPAASGDRSSLRVEISTRTGVYTARMMAVADSAAAFVVELADMAGCPHVCRRATAALLLAASGSLRLVKGAFVQNDGTEMASLVSPFDLALGPWTDEALSALTVGCQLVGREVQALLDEGLAAEYLALSGVPDEHDARTLVEQEEEQPCLQ